MFVTSSRRHALVVTGAITLGLATSMASTAAAVPAKLKPKTPVYAAEVMGPRADATPYVVGTQAIGISNAGEVLIRESWNSAFVANGRSVRTLADASAVTQYGAWPRVMTGSGDVYGGGFDVIAKWTRRGVVTGSVSGIGRDSGIQTLSVQAANNRGDVAGCASYYRIGYPFIGSFPRKTAQQLTWPGGSSGNCSVTDMSDRGVATVNQEAPNYRTEEIYPRAATMTTSGVRFLKTPDGVGSRASAISPDGTLIVGSIYKDGVATTSWLSKSRAPVALRGAGDLMPSVVTNDAVVFGVADGRAVSWQNGRTADLTSVSSLPRGWVLTGVSDINKRGQLAVTATITATNETVAMRLTPAKVRR